MSWDRKKGGPERGYYYVSLRVPEKKHPVKRYVGRGEAAKRMADYIAHQKQERNALRKQRLAEQEATAEADALLAELTSWSRALHGAWLVISGHKKHKGEWRPNHVSTKNQK